MSEEETAPPAPEGEKLGTLYVVSTPIGNLDDMTLRAIKTLKEVPVIAAEDTRSAQNLLRHFEIARPTMVSFFEGNEAGRTEHLLARLRGGDDVALISEAGTPGVSDPGARLVAAAVAAGVRVVPVPGASAALAALVASGLPSDEFYFVGFPARDGGPRLQAFAVPQSPADHRRLHGAEQQQCAGAGRERDVSERERRGVREQRERRDPVAAADRRMIAHAHDQPQRDRPAAQADRRECRGIDLRGMQREAAQQRVAGKRDHRQHDEGEQPRARHQRSRPRCGGCRGGVVAGCVVTSRALSMVRIARS